VVGTVNSQKTCLKTTSIGGGSNASIVVHERVRGGADRSRYWWIGSSLLVSEINYYCCSSWHLDWSPDYFPQLIALPGMIYCNRW